MKLHPLINEKSPHYNLNATSAIEELEKRLSVMEMIGFCRANIFKYNYRKNHKGQRESDEEKIHTYEEYLFVLYELRDAGYEDDTVALALQKAMIAYRYR